MNFIAKSNFAPFSSGLRGSPSNFRPGDLRLGPVRLAQAPEAPLSKAARDQALATLDAALAKASSVDIWRSTHPDWEISMGSDAQLAISMATSASPLLPIATRVRQTLQSADPAAWVVSAKDLSDTASWTTFATGIYDLTAKHTPTMPAPPAGAALPGTTMVSKTDYTIPVAIGASVLLLAFLFFKR